MKSFWISILIFVIGTLGTFLLSGALEKPGILISFFLVVSTIAFLILFLYEKIMNKFHEIEKELEEIKTLIKK
jgi:hypothetical protein